MSARKTERMMNLFFMLLSTRQFLTRDQIRDSIQDYRDSNDAAFEKKFERDKEELRDLGIEIETGSHDAYFDDQLGYRIRRDAVELPDLALTREESAVVGIAAGLWDHAGMAGSSARALTKLKSIGISIDASAVQLTEPRLQANEPEFDAVWEATRDRVEISFDYQVPGHVAARRSLQPWKLVNWRSRWYVVGHDLDRRATRMFRLSRMIGAVEQTSGPGNYAVPDDIDTREVAATLFPPEPTEPATLVVRHTRAQSLRRRADSTERVDDAFDRVSIKFAQLSDFAAEVASFGPDVEVESPPQLRDAVRDHLATVVSAHGGIT